MNLRNLFLTDVVIFDLDNTLINTKDVFIKNFRKALKQIDPVKEKNFSNINITKVLKKNLKFENIFNELYPENSKNLLNKYREIAPYIKYSPTVGGLELKYFLESKKIYHGILTNRINLISQRLNQAGYLNNFDFIESSPKEFPKPFGEAFNKILPIIKNKKNPLYIGDHIHDFQSAKNKNINFIAVLSGFNTKEDFIREGLHPDFIFSTLNQFLKHLERI